MLPAPQEIRLGVHELSGRHVRELLAGRRLPAGFHSVIWDGRDELGRVVSAGTYCYRIEAGPFHEARKMTPPG